jgi:hypothetical protein
MQEAKKIKRGFSAAYDFGPILPIQTFNSIDEAIALANKTANMA